MFNNFKESNKILELNKEQQIIQSNLFQIDLVYNEDYEKNSSYEKLLKFFKNEKLNYESLN